MILHDFFDRSNSGVGLAGLALTVGALWQATGAKKAATEAREAIRQREASDTFSELGALAGDVVQLLQFERSKEAAVRARDLVARIPRDRARFERFLGGDSDKLKEIESVFQGLAVKLSSELFLEERGAVKAAIAAAFEANGELNAVYGRLLARLDKEDK
jgi:hypothetical protein